MGDLQVWSQLPIDINVDETDSSLCSNQDPLSMTGVDCWLRAEQTIQEIIQTVQPTVASEQNRKSVIEYVQSLIGGHIGIQVFPYGSVPLKTYLPDGDIDLTVFCSQAYEEDLAKSVHDVLEREEHNKGAVFKVKDVQYINAEVRLVKCLIQDIVVDISFNQLGGQCTLCFLEKVDHLIGKDHLFKRSIILIKAWCYYESRILGAHHGLISTYALETLILYIFHLFYNSLDGPLAVLYRFMDYFGRFDWDNYCVSLNGPVCISSLPAIVAMKPENDGGDLLLCKELLKDCVDIFSAQLKGSEDKPRVFMKKYFNIVDPLRENNNLGRSVSRGNFYRIRSAFTYGSRKLGKVLLLPQGYVEDELQRFFTNTLSRHGNGRRPDVQEPLLTSVIHESGPASMLRFKKHPEDKINVGSLPEAPSEGIHQSRLSATERKGYTRNNNGARKPSTNMGSSSKPVRSGSIVSGSHLPGDAGNLPASSRTQGPKVRKETSKHTPPCRTSVERMHLEYKKNDSLNVRWGRTKALTSLDLSGKLNCVKCCSDTPFNESALPTSTSEPCNKFPVVTMGQLKLITASQLNANRGGRASISDASCGVSEVPRLRGTGTYIPSRNHHSYRDKATLGREKLIASRQEPLQAERKPNADGRVITMQEENMSEIFSQTLLEAEMNPIEEYEGPTSRKNSPQSNNWGTAAQEDKAIEESIHDLLSEADFPLLPSCVLPKPLASGRSPVKASPNDNGSSSPPALSQVSKQSESGSSSEGSPSVATSSAERDLIPKDERCSGPATPYYLKDDTDFPPLLGVPRRLGRKP